VRWWWPQCSGGGDQPPLYVTLHLFAFTNNQSRLVCRANGWGQVSNQWPRDDLDGSHSHGQKAATIDPEQRKASSSLLQEVEATSTKTPPQSEEAADANGGNAHPNPKCLKTKKKTKRTTTCPNNPFRLPPAASKPRHSMVTLAKCQARCHVTSRICHVSPLFDWIVHMQRYQLGPDWRPIKLKVCLLDLILEHLDF